MVKTIQSLSELQTIINFRVIYYIMQFLKNCTKFRALMQQETLQVPGAFNGMTARLAAETGFKSLYISGAAVTASSGVPDIGIQPIDKFTATIKEVAIASNLPVIADADTGFGEGECIAKTVWEYFINGASGLHIEDQVFPKRCGHLDGKELVPVQDFKKKVEIARNASLECSGGEFVICARTDARSVEGLEAVITRSKAYIDSGADMIFPEGLQSAEEFEQVAKALKEYKSNVFLLANMTEFGKTPIISVDEFAKWGYSIVIYPVSTLRVANKAIENFLRDLKQNGGQQNQIENMQTRQELYSTLQYKPGVEWYYPKSTNKE